MGRLSGMLKVAQDPMMMAQAGGMPMDPATMGGGMPMDPAMMGGGMPMDPAMMGGAPMDPAAMGGGMPPVGGMPIDPNMLAMIANAPAGAPGAAEPEPSIDQNLLQQSLRVADSALDLAKAQTEKVDDISTQLATVLQASGALEGIGPQDLQDIAAAHEAEPPVSI